MQSIGLGDITHICTTHTFQKPKANKNYIYFIFAIPLIKKGSPTPAARIQDKDGDVLLKKFPVSIFNPIMAPTIISTEI